MPQWKKRLLLHFRLTIMVYDMTFASLCEDWYLMFISDSRFNIFFIKQQQLLYKNGIITSTINRIRYNEIIYEATERKPFLKHVLQVKFSKVTCYRFAGQSKYSQWISHSKELKRCDLFTKIKVYPTCFFFYKHNVYKHTEAQISKKLSIF